MNFRIKISKHLSIGPSGPRLLTKHASIGASGLLLHGKGGSVWLPTRDMNKPLPKERIRIVDGRYKVVPEWLPDEPHHSCLFCDEFLTKNRFSCNKCKEKPPIRRFLGLFS